MNMPKLRYILSCLLLLVFLSGSAAPKLHPTRCKRLFTAQEYGAHTQNFAICCDAQGIVYVANFEGLLRYDHAGWQVFHTPGIARTVALKTLPDGRIAVFDYHGDAFVLENEQLVPLGEDIEMPKVDEFDIPEAKDPYGGRWAITEQGILYTASASAFSYMGKDEGLEGEVLSLLDTPEGLYAGTTQGIFLCRGNHFEQVEGVYVTCWQLLLSPDGSSVMAATAQGLCRVQGLRATTLSTMHALSICYDGKGMWIGELDKVCYFDEEHFAITQEYPVDNPYKLLMAKDKTLWIGTLSTECFYLKRGDKALQKSPYDGGLAMEDGDVYVNGSEGTWIWDTATRSLRPQSMEEGDDENYITLFSHSDPRGQNFIGKADSKGLWVFAKRQESTDYCQWCMPFETMFVRAVAMTKEYVTVGGDFGVYFLRTDSISLRKTQPCITIRKVVLDDDNFYTSFSTDHLPLPGRCLYSYRMDDNPWSEYSEVTSYDEQNLGYGNHRFEVKCTDEFGIESEVVSTTFYIEYPIYLKWYAWVFYILLSALLVQGITRWRMARMRAENQHLEQVVAERTASLQAAQQKLARQEKLEMMGKLIQGLIDRILNPMNYILNFTKLTGNLRNDLAADVDDEQEHITEDNYEDMQDILDMMQTNLTKIEEHSTNTTRILKAMEELLRDRSGHMSPMSLTELIEKCGEMTRTYYHEDITKMGVDVVFDISPDPIVIEGNAEHISKSVMSLVANSFYAIRKKFEEKPFTPQFKVSLSREGNTAILRIRDNGIGIEDTIMGKIYDPFFTTKPTAEAAGVGLYLTRDVMQTHHGDITCQSVKGESCEFIIQLNIETNE